MFSREFRTKLLQMRNNT